MKTPLDSNPTPTKKTSSKGNQKPVENSHKFNFLIFFQEFRRDPFIKNLVKTLVFIISIAYPFYFKTSNPLIYSGISVAILIIMYSSWLYAKTYHNLKTRIIICSATFIFVCFVGFLTYHFTKTPADICDNPQTLYEHFKCPDFEKTYQSHHRYLSLTSSDTNQIKSLKSYRYFTHLYMDFEANSCFIGYYLPTSAQIVNICIALSLRTDTIVTESKNKHLKVEINSKNKKELFFTRQVYIYHETRLFKEDKDSIINAFKRKNLNVDFFDNDYFLNERTNSIKIEKPN